MTSTCKIIDGNHRQTSCIQHTCIFFTLPVQQKCHTELSPLRSLSCLQGAFLGVGGHGLRQFYKIFRPPIKNCTKTY